MSAPDGPVPEGAPERECAPIARVGGVQRSSGRRLPSQSAPFVAPRRAAALPWPQSAVRAVEATQPCSLLPKLTPPPPPPPPPAACRRPPGRVPSWPLLADCPGTASDQAGKAAACDGCPNQAACASAPKGPDPDLAAIAERLAPGAACAARGAARGQYKSQLDRASTAARSSAAVARLCCRLCSRNRSRPPACGGSHPVGQPPALPAPHLHPPFHCPPLGAVKHVVLVLSGKGGVGKSTFSAQLAFALAARGLDVSELCGAGPARGCRGGLVAGPAGGMPAYARGPAPPPRQPASPSPSPAPHSPGLPKPDRRSTGGPAGH